MNLGRQGKIAVVSGSTAGIGLAIAVALSAEGARVIINGRTEARVAEAIEKIRQRVPGAEPRGIAADLGISNGVEAFLRKAPDADVLVNNLGIFDPQPFLEIPDAEWMRFFEVNVLSGVRLTRKYLPGMLKKNWGRVIFISSESSQMIPTEMVHYGMTKTAQVAIARGLAQTVAGTGVSVNSVLAGPTDSEGAGIFLDSLAKQNNISRADVEKLFFEKARPSSLLKRFETPDEIAAVVAFVASTHGMVMNGAAIRAEGGVISTAF
jgi:NAD(P)-dependent dehydrogenase (short-subunit alcohol dehydrogenase family)